MTWASNIVIIYNELKHKQHLLWYICILLWLPMKKFSCLKFLDMLTCSYSWLIQQEICGRSMFLILYILCSKRKQSSYYPLRPKLRVRLSHLFKGYTNLNIINDWEYNLLLLKARFFSHLKPSLDAVGEDCFSSLYKQRRSISWMGHTSESWVSLIHYQPFLLCVCVLIYKLIVLSFQSLLF